MGEGWSNLKILKPNGSLASLELCYFNISTFEILPINNIKNSMRIFDLGT